MLPTNAMNAANAANAANAMNAPRAPGPAGKRPGPMPSQRQSSIVKDLKQAPRFKIGVPPVEGGNPFGDHLGSFGDLACSPTWPDGQQPANGQQLAAWLYGVDLVRRKSPDSHRGHADRAYSVAASAQGATVAPGVPAAAPVEGRNNPASNSKSSR
jgi:hypothetical protein